MGVTPTARLAQSAETAQSSRVSDEHKRLIVVGDRVLISPEEGEERTNVGLYLPPSAIEGRQVQGGRIVASGAASDIAAGDALEKAYLAVA